MYLLLTLFIILYSCSRTPYAAEIFLKELKNHKEQGTNQMRNGDSIYRNKAELEISAELNLANIVSKLFRVFYTTNTS
jgi:hypothetical protein